MNTQPTILICSATNRKERWARNHVSKKVAHVWPCQQIMQGKGELSAENKHITRANTQVRLNTIRE